MSLKNKITRYSQAEVKPGTDAIQLEYFSMRNASLIQPMREPTHLYYISGDGHVSRKNKKDGTTEVLHPNAVKRDNKYLYFLDKEGDIARAERVTKR